MSASKGMTIASPGESSNEIAHDITREELLSRLSDPTLLIVNVLPEEAWEDVRIPGSISLPIAEIPEQARAVLGDFARDIAIYCGGPT